MTKDGLIDALTKETGLSKNKAKKAVNLFIDEMSKALTNGDRVEIRGFCSIVVRNYKGYTARNPRTGDPTYVRPKKLPFFKCGKELKDRVDYPQT